VKPPNDDREATLASGSPESERTVSRLIRDLGPLEIKFEAGRVVLVKKTETIKPSGEGAGRNYRDNRGSTNGRDF
jgi:hypothetical protein